MARSARWRPLWLLGGMLLLAAGAWLVQSWNARAAARERFEELLAEVDAQLAAPAADGGELSRLMAKLREADSEDRRARLAQAAIEHARGRYEPASELLEPLLRGGNAAELRLAAEVWMSWHAHGGKDAAERRVLGQRALDHADAAYALSGDAGDLFLAWQMAVRLPEDAVAQQRAATMLAQHPDHRLAKVVELAGGAADQPVQPVLDLLADWPKPPIELRLTKVVRQFRQGELVAVAEELDSLLQEAPNLFEVRHWTAAAHHLLAMAAEPGPARQRHLGIRDTHLDWLELNAPAEDRRRSLWLDWRNQR